ncbi:MAG: NAD(P)-dependent alcohol dehydrogenase [bacterium]|nr:NAD(P)-dependent alcohol dehydrogenase [bacterium]
MKAVVYTKYGSPEVLRLTEIERPTPKEDEVLVKIHATTVTTGDVNLRNFVFVPKGFGLMARLMIGLNKPKKPVIGLEFAGEVVEIGKSVTRFKVGDKVFGLDGKQMGSYAQYKTVAQDVGITTMPANMSYEDAVSIPNGALTALTFLRNMGKVQKGQNVLIYGASGSVGIAGVQIAKALGAVVTGVCSTKNVELVKAAGADKVIDYTQQDFTQNGEVYDLILDTVAKAPFAISKKSLTPNGSYLAVAGGMLEMRQMMGNAFRGGKKVMAGSSSESQDGLIFIKGLVEAGKFRPMIDRCYPLEQIVEAHRYVDSGRKRGNVVISVSH